MLHPVNEIDEKPRGARLVTAITTTTALSLSVLFHGSLPFLGNLIRDKRQATSIELVAAAVPPKVLPEAAKDKDGPAKDPDPEGEKADSNKDAKSGDKQVAKKSPPPKKVEAKKAKPTKAKPARRAARRAPPKPTRKANLHRARSSASVTRMTRAERLEQIRKMRARSSKGKKSGKSGGKGADRGDDGKGGGEGGGSAHAAGGKKGKIEPVYACTKDGLGQKVNVRYERPIGDWVTIMPTVLMPFRTRPGLDDYLPGVSQIVSRKRRGIEKAGPVEFALPASVVQLGVDKPGVRVAIGHLEGRCLVGMRYAKQLFPIELMKVPVRVIDSRGNSATALAHIKLFKDASFDITATEGSLPFSSGRLQNADNIAGTIEQHYSAARAFKEVAGWFGVDVRKMARERRVERAKKRSSQVRKSRRVSRSR